MSAGSGQEPKDKDGFYKKEKKPPADGRMLSDPAFTVGTDLAANIIIGGFLGWLCIKYFPMTKPWGLIGFLVLGIASGYWQLYKKTRPGPEKGKDKEKGSGKR